MLEKLTYDDLLSFLAFLYNDSVTKRHSHQHLPQDLGLFTIFCFGILCHQLSQLPLACGIKPNSLSIRYCELFEDQSVFGQGSSLVCKHILDLAKHFIEPV